MTRRQGELLVDDIHHLSLRGRIWRVRFRGAVPYICGTLSREPLSVHGSYEFAKVMSGSSFVVQWFLGSRSITDVWLGSAAALRRWDAS